MSASLEWLIGRGVKVMHCVIKFENNDKSLLLKKKKKIL